MNKPICKPLLFIILDGWGISPKSAGNAIEAAQLKYWENLWQNFPHTELQAGGSAVGLPEGQFGNSEVGHLNLGAGRVVYQDISRINNDIEDKTLFQKEVLLKALHELSPNKKLHLMGLLSDGGVHSSEKHYLALLDFLHSQGFPKNRLCFHAISDGRDTAPQSVERFLKNLQSKLDELQLGFIASLSGRYYAMDRDKNWDRTKAYYECLTLGQGEIAPDALSAVQTNYQEDIYDEFIKPTLIAKHRQGLGRIEEGDLLFFFNFRGDRARQICQAFTEQNSFDQDCFLRSSHPKIHLLTMTQYAEQLQAQVLYPPEHIQNTLGEHLSKQGIKQFRCAETEKYAHITYFFNGGIEEPFPGEERCLIPSPKVATYDLQPEMSLPEVTQKLSDALTAQSCDFILSNFANGDMVGHTGNFEAAQQAAKSIDQSLEQLIPQAQKSGYNVLITADHGNCEEMLGQDGKKVTQHSHNPVPLLLVPLQEEYTLAEQAGILADVAPTILELMELPIPAAMKGKSLLKKNTS